MNLQGIKTLSKLHIYSKMTNKKTCHKLGQLYSFIIKSLKKNILKFICMEKLFLGKRACSPFLK